MSRNEWEMQVLQRIQDFIFDLEEPSSVFPSVQQAILALGISLNRYVLFSRPLGNFVVVSDLKFLIYWRVVQLEHGMSAPRALNMKNTVVLLRVSSSESIREKLIPKPRAVKNDVYFIHRLLSRLANDSISERFVQCPSPT